MPQIRSLKELAVGIDFGEEVLPVGSLNLKEGAIVFEYDDSFIGRGLEISPIRLALKTGQFSFSNFLFEGLPGVFYDSLPDGWGRLIFDRFARSCGILPAEVSPLDRLAHVGHQALGALVFDPDQSGVTPNSGIDLERVAKDAKEVLEGRADEVLQELIALNGSSAGARPKALIALDRERNNMVHGTRKLPNGSYSHWIVKFPNLTDGSDAGAIEYVYSQMAKEAGIGMPETHLFPSINGGGYFAVKRFDRVGDRRLHLHTVCGLLHSDFRVPALDYCDLLTLTRSLSCDQGDVEKIYRLAVFNVLAHNRDDHSKNFSFLMNDFGQWRLSPAYDLTFSSGPRGEQSMMVVGEGRRPGMEHLIKLAEGASIPRERAVKIIDVIRDSLSKWPDLAKNCGVRPASVKLVQERLIC
jgi:serine/threonine-protein kinase HipA